MRKYQKQQIEGTGTPAKPEARWESMMMQNVNVLSE